MNDKMEKYKISMEMLKGEGEKILFNSITTDEILNFYGWGENKKPLKFVVCKGYIADWCVYVEAMDREMNFEQVKDYGNKISPETAKKLIDCNEEVLNKYRI